MNPLKRSGAILRSKATTLTAGALLFVGMLVGAGVGSAQEDGADAQPIPGFQVEDGVAQGVWVEVELHNETGDLRQFNVGGDRWFSAVSLPGPFEWTVSGDGLILEGEEFLVVIQDHPRGVMRVQSAGKPASVTAAGGVGVWDQDTHIEFRSNGKQAVFTNAVRDRHLVFVSSGTFLRIGGDVDTVMPSASEDVEPADPGLIDELAATGRVAAWVDVSPDALRGSALTGMDLEVQEHREATYRAIMDSPGERSRLVVVDIAPDLVEEERFQVGYYEEVMRFLVPASIERVDSFNAVVSNYSEQAPVYWVVPGYDGIRIVVSLAPDIPQGIEVGWGPPRTEPVVVIGLLVGFVAVAGAVGILFSDRLRFLR